MKKHLKQKIGLVSLRFDEKEQRWRTSFADPVTGKRQRLRIPVATETEAIAWCVEQNRRLLEGRGMLLPGVRARRQGLPIRDALLKAISTSRGQAKHKGRLLDEAEHFMEWISDKYPGLVLWEQVTRDVWRAYDTKIQAEKLSRDGLKHRWEPLRKTSRFMADEDPSRFNDHLRSCNIKLPDEPWREPPTLELEQLVEILDWLEANASDIWPLAALAGLGGVREYEAAFARQCDINLRNKSFSVDEANNHLPKNAYSYRTVTMCAQLTEILQRYLASRQIRPISSKEGFFAHRDGKPWTFRRLERRWETVMAKLRTADFELPSGFCARHFRHTFCTLTEFEAGVNRQALLRYTGRAPEGIMGKKYQRMRPQQLTRLLVQPWERWLTENWNASHGNNNEHLA